MADVHRIIQNLDCRKPATTEAIARFERTTGKQLPGDYAEFVKITDGGDGFIGRAYVILWSIGELISMNEAYEVESYAPGLLIFGSDGGGEAYGFDTRNPQWVTVEMPFVGMGWSLARPIATSFTEFLDHLFRIK